MREKASIVFLFILTSTLLLSAVSSFNNQAATTPAATNLLMNPGFESGTLSPWKQWHDAWIVKDKGHSGSYALQIGIGPSDGEQNINWLTPNTTYTFSAWGYTESANEPLHIGVKNFGGSETSQTITSNSYSQVTFNLTTGATDSSATIYCYKANGNANGYCDDFQLISSAEPVKAFGSIPEQTPSSEIYWGAYINGVPWDMAKLAAFENNAGKGVSIVHFGQPWIKGGVYSDFPTTIAETVRQHGAIPMINWSSWDICCGISQSDWRLSNIYKGTYDAYIRQWATDAKAWGHSFFLRFDHEMNGWWQFPWSVQVNNNQPGDYVKAWQHVHDIFTEVGATNVTWVWCPNIVGPNTTPLSLLYPGDNYVDWTGLDGYNWGTDRRSIWQSFNQVFGQSYIALTQLAPGKPIIIAEMASSENGGNKGNWITDALETQLVRNFPAIKAVVWFNWDDDDSSLSWPLESSSASLAALKKGLASPYYAPNKFTSTGNGPVQPLK